MPFVSGGGGGGANGLVKLFESTLAAPGVLDTGANGIAAGHGDLLVFLVGQATTAANLVQVLITLNGDSTSGHYDREVVGVNNSTVTGGPTVGATSMETYLHGNNGTTGYPSATTLLIPSYDLTVWNKVCALLDGATDATAANNAASYRYQGWRSTAAVNQITFTPASGNLAIGSRLVVYGTK